MRSAARLATVGILAALSLGAGLGNQSIGSDNKNAAAMSSTCTSGLGSNPLGNGICAASPVFDTGDPEDLTWGTRGLSTVADWTRDFPNTAAVAPKLCYRAEDISGTTWTAIIGPDLEQTGAGAFAEPDSPLGTSAQTVTNSHYYATGATLASDLIASGDDFYVEALQRLDATATTDYAWGLLSSDGGGGNSRFYHYNSDGNTYFQRDGSLTRKSLNAVATSGVWNVVSQAQTSGVTASAYVNGVSTDNDAFTETGGAPDTGWSVDIGALYTGSNAGAVSVGYLCFWSGDLFDNAAEQDAHAAKSFAIATGSALATPADTAPSVATRASSSYLRVCDPTANTTTYHQVGDNWPRREVSCGYTWDSPTSSETRVSSFLVEPAGVNVINFSTDYTDAGFTKAGTDTISADDTQGPMGELCDGLVASTTSGSHSIRYTTVLADPDVFSWIAKAGDQTHLVLTRSGALTTYYDLTDCTISSTPVTTLVDTQGIQDLGGGWCRGWAALSGATGGAWTYLQVAESDGDITFAGDGSTVSTHICNWGQDNTATVVSSPIVTVDATDVTRSADTLFYPLADTLNMPFTYIADFLANTDNATGYYFQLHEDNTAGGDRADFYGGTSPIARYRYGSSQNLAVWTGIPDNARGIARVTMSGLAGVGVLYANGVEDETLDPLTTPGGDDGHNLACIGMSCVTGTGGQRGSAIYRARAFDSVIAPGEQGTGSDTP